MREQIPCLLVLLRLSRLASGLISELRPQVGISIFGSLQQNRNRLRMILGPPVEIDRRPHHTQYFLIFAVECFHILLSRLKVFAAFVQANQRIAKLQAGYGIDRERGLPLQRVLANRFQRFLLRQVFDVFRLLDGGSTARDRVQQSFHFRLAVLRFQNLYPKIDRSHRKVGRAGRCDDFRSALIDELAELRAARECEQPEFGRRISGTGERALYIFFDGVGILALVLVDRPRFICIERRIREAIATLVQQSKCVIEIIVIPVNGRSFEVSTGLTRSDSRNTFPVRSRFRKLIAVRIDVADPGENLGVARIGL